MRNTFVNLLLQRAKQDERIIFLTGDLGYGVVDQFARELPRQFVNFGINEQTMMSAAAGLASQGFKPYVYSIGNFPTFRCLEQIRNDVCYMNLDVTIIALGAGFAYGAAGYSHHLIEDISAISPLPNIRIFSPADTHQTELVAEKTFSISGPKYVRLGRGGEGNLSLNFSGDTFGLSIMKGSSDIAIISTGNILEESINVKSLRPDLDPTLISCYDLSVIPDFAGRLEFGKILSLEEHVLRGGFGSLVQEHLLSFKGEFKRIGIARIDSHVSGSQEFLRDHYGLSKKKLSEKLD